MRLRQEVQEVGGERRRSPAHILSSLRPCAILQLMGREDEYKRVKEKLSDPARPRTSWHQIKKNATAALSSHLFTMTLGLQFPPSTTGRSAIYVKLDDNYFIFTASHQLEKDQVNEIWAVPRPSGP